MILVLIKVILTSGFWMWCQQM